MSTIIANVVVSIILIAAVTAAILYIRKEKKKGVKCIGCPMAGNCSKARACHELSK